MTNKKLIKQTKRIISKKTKNKSISKITKILKSKNNNPKKINNKLANRKSKKKKILMKMIKNNKVFQRKKKKAHQVIQKVIQVILKINKKIKIMNN